MLIACRATRTSVVTSVHELALSAHKHLHLGLHNTVTCAPALALLFLPGFAQNTLAIAL